MSSRRNGDSSKKATRTPLAPAPCSLMNLNNIPKRKTTTTPKVRARVIRNSKSSLQKQQEKMKGLQQELDQLVTESADWVESCFRTVSSPLPIREVLADYRGRRSSISSISGEWWNNSTSLQEEELSAHQGDSLVELERELPIQMDQKAVDPPPTDDDAGSLPSQQMTGNSLGKISVPESRLFPEATEPAAENEASSIASQQKVDGILGRVDISEARLLLELDDDDEDDIVVKRSSAPRRRRVSFQLPLKRSSNSNKEDESSPVSASQNTPKAEAVNPSEAKSISSSKSPVNSKMKTIYTQPRDSMKLEWRNETDDEESPVLSLRSTTNRKRTDSNCLLLPIPLLRDHNAGRRIPTAETSVFTPSPHKNNSSVYDTGTGRSELSRRYPSLSNYSTNTSHRQYDDTELEELRLEKSLLLKEVLAERNQSQGLAQQLAQKQEQLEALMLQQREPPEASTTPTVPIETPTQQTTTLEDLSQWGNLSDTPDDDDCSRVSRRKRTTLLLPFPLPLHDTPQSKIREENRTSDHGKTIEEEEQAIKQEPRSPDPLDLKNRDDEQAIELQQENHQPFMPPIKVNDQTLLTRIPEDEGAEDYEEDIGEVIEQRDNLLVANRKLYQQLEAFRKNVDERLNPFRDVFESIRHSQAEIDQLRRENAKLVAENQSFFASMDQLQAQVEEGVAMASEQIKTVTLEKAGLQHRIKELEAQLARGEDGAKGQY